MEQKSKHSDNCRPSYENPKLKRSYGQKIPNSEPIHQKFHKIHIECPKIMKSLPNIHNMPIYIFASFPSQIKSKEGVCTSHDPHRLLSPSPVTQIILQRSPPLPSSSWPLLKLALLPDDDRACLLLTDKHQHPLPPSSLPPTAICRPCGLRNPAA